MKIKNWSKHLVTIAEKKQQAREMFAEGAKNEDVARTLGVDLKVVIYWRKEYYNSMVKQENKQEAQYRKERTCLCCGKKFISASAANRICYWCKERTSYLAGTVFYMGL